MKRFVMAIALASVLSVSALAGDVHTVGAPAPPPPPGEMGSGGDQGNGGLTDDGDQGAGGLVLMILDLLF